MIIASVEDGRVVPWFLSAGEIPVKFVQIPEELLARYSAGEFQDGKELARAALALNAAVGTAPNNTFVPPPATAKKDKSAAVRKSDAADESPRTVKV